MDEETPHMHLIFLPVVHTTDKKGNSYLHNVIDKFRETIHEFIEWICVNFDMGTGDTLIRDFERETRTCLDGEEQIKREKREIDLEIER